MTPDQQNQARQDRVEKMTSLYAELGIEPPAFDTPMPDSTLTTWTEAVIGCGFFLSLLLLLAAIFCILFKLLF